MLLERNLDHYERDCPNPLGLIMEASAKKGSELALISAFNLSRV